MRMTDGKILALLLAVLLMLAAMDVLSGCTGQPPGSEGAPGAQTAVRVLYVQGSGGIGMEVYGQAVDMAWSEHGIEHDGELIHCSTLDRLMFNGISLGSGVMPPPVSNEACAEHLPPFRPGAAPLAPGAGAEAGVVGAVGGTREGTSAGGAEAGAGGAVTNHPTTAPVVTEADSGRFSGDAPPPATDGETAGN